MNVILLPEVQAYFRNLVIILYDKEYFSFKDSAKKYVDELLDDILMTLPTRPHKPAPKYFDKYGKDMEYAVFTKNKRTSWYVLFTTYEDEETGEDIFLIRFIGNNHTVSQYL